MGLDQYWFAHKSQDGGEEEEFHYHRKVPALQAFMENEWENIGENSEFNLAHLPVTTELLDRLEEACKNKTLDHNASGFFWGVHCDSDYDDILVAVSKARDKINEGYYVTYFAWY